MHCNAIVLTREFGIEDSLSTTAHRSHASNRTNIYGDGRFEAQDALPVHQYGLSLVESLLDDRSHGHQEGPFSAFDRLDNDCIVLYCIVLKQRN